MIGDAGMHAEPEAGSVVVHTEGPVRPSDVSYAQRKLAAVLSHVPAPVLFSKVDLVVHEDPARERPAFAKAELDLDGRFVRAHATATTLPEAVDRLEDRLRERVERAAHRQESIRLRHRDGAHEWRHGDEPTARRPFFPRPPDEREVVRRKTFSVDALTPDEAVLALEQLDHDFYLFTNVQTGEDDVLYRVGDGCYALSQPSESGGAEVPGDGIVPSPIRPAAMTLEEAIVRLDAGEEPFVFFLDPETRRGRVVYRRYDGHYGVITPARDTGPG